MMLVHPEYIAVGKNSKIWKHSIKLKDVALGMIDSLKDMSENLKKSFGGTNTDGSPCIQNGFTVARNGRIILRMEI